MLYALATPTPSTITTPWQFPYIELPREDSIKSELPADYRKNSLFRSYASDYYINISFYDHLLTPRVRWLGAVEWRLSAAMAQNTDDLINNPGEYISKSVSDYALKFFRETADLLPTEPHLYATPPGDLVAEFETEQILLTLVISEKHIIAFGSTLKDRSEPKYITLEHGSARLRSQIKMFLNGLTSGTHGKMDTPV